MSHQVSKQTLKHDEFTESLMTAIDFVKRHTTEVLAAGVAALIVIVGLAVIGQNRAKSEREAGLMLSSVHGALYGGQFQQAEQGYNEIVKRYGSSSAAREALVSLGNLKFRQGRYDEAQQFYDRCVRAGTPNLLIMHGALTGQAACFEQKGDFAKAGEKYLEIARKYSKEPFLASEALIDAGRCFAGAGQNDRAKNAYQTVLDGYSQSQAFAQAKAQLAMLFAR
ncbi:MAG: tetratricopeptide repeat protein [Candidatus Edwardsbacteria bacterium]|nr:tetratricopeptide repeat protein [Candidatus Edwardsbacteria bacterium]